MLNNFLFKKIPISYKKFFPYSKLLSNKPILFYFTLNFLNKINFFLKKIIYSIINCCKTIKLFINKFSIGKSIYIKKIFYRAKGRVNFKKKMYTNIFITVKNG